MTCVARGGTCAEAEIKGRNQKCTQTRPIPKFKFVISRSLCTIDLQIATRIKLDTAVPMGPTNIYHKRLSFEKRPT